MKLTLNELRKIVRSVIKEELENSTDNTFNLLSVITPSPKKINLGNGFFSLNWGSCKESGYDWCLAGDSQTKRFSIVGDNKKKVLWINKTLQAAGFTSKARDISDYGDFTYENVKPEIVVNTIKTILNKMYSAPKQPVIN
jgi:hypothetical protein